MSDQPVYLGDLGTLSMPAGTSSYVSQLQSLAGRLSDDQRRCLVNLTGGTPIAALALDARPAGFPWLLGGYPGSAEAASYWLAGDECVDGRFALLEAPGGERSIQRPTSFAGREFRVVGEVRFDGYLVETQVLSVAVDEADK